MIRVPRKERMARPVGKWFVQSGTCAVRYNVSGLGAMLPAKMEIRAARVLIITAAFQGPFLVSGFRAAVRLSGHLASTTRDICNRRR